VHALIKNNEVTTIVAVAILPMLFVSIDRKYLLLTGLQTSQRADPTVYRRINHAEVSFPVVLCAL
jgi:hypothetical protein